ncbi:MAG: Crp/Fnr family transcriptional regulator [Betaproteobacteria bacterium]
MPDNSPAASQLMHIADPAVRELAALGQLRAFRRNAVIITEGDATDSMHVIIEGRVKVFVSNADGGEMVLRFYGPGEYFGEMSLDGGVRSASVITVEPTRCAVLSRAALRAAIVDNPDLALQLIEQLIARTRVATENIRQLALFDVYGRIALLLNSLAVERDGARIVPEKLTQQEIANRVGASRDMVSRILKELVDGGYIAIESKIITICRKLPARR